MPFGEVPEVVVPAPLEKGRGSVRASRLRRDSAAAWGARRTLLRTGAPRPRASFLRASGVNGTFGNGGRRQREPSQPHKKLGSIKLTTGKIYVAVTTEDRMETGGVEGEDRAAKGETKHEV